MKFNHAVYAAREDTANARQAVSIKLDAAGNPVNTAPNGQPFHYATIRAAQDRQSYRVYSDVMTFLDAIIGDDADTKTRKAFDQAKAKFVSVGHAIEMRDKLITAALNGSNAALIAYAAASIFLNPYAQVDFSWFVSGQTFATTDDQGYEAATKTVNVTVSISFPTHDTVADYEGFAVTYRPTPTVPVTVARPTREKHAPAPAAPVVAPALPVPTPEKPTPTMTLVHSHGSELVRTATGWQAESKSNSGQTHTTSHDGSSCTCAGFRGRYRKCWHTATVRAYVAQQESEQQRQERANALPVSPPRRRGRSKMWK